MDKVSIVKIGEFKESLKRAIEHIREIPNIQSQIILIKPNICSDRDVSGGATTDIQLIRALIDLILEKEEKSTIKIVESDSAGKYLNKAFENLGYLKLEDEYKSKGLNISLINLSRESTENISFNGAYFKNRRLPKILSQPKYYITFAKAKTHGLTYITGALKNQYGCLPEKDKVQHHRHITEAIIDLNLTIKPDLSIIDANIGMEGVNDGLVKNLGLIICGRYPLSVDATLARVMGFNPHKIRQLTYGIKRGLEGSINPHIIGEKIENVVTPLKPPHTTIAGLATYIPPSIRPFASKIYKRLITKG